MVVPHRESEGRRRPPLRRAGDLLPAAVSIRRQPQPGDSPLRARQAIAAHVAVAEIGPGRFRHAERVRRADGQFAGFATDDLRVWLGDWTLERRMDDTLVARASDRESGLAVELSYRPAKALVRQGVDGYSQKGADPGNASAYLSWTRLEVAGTLVLDGRELEVEGAGWFDHEWGTSQLGEGVAGWDWFSLRLDDGSELMVYRLRREDGSPDPYSSGTLVARRRLHPTTDRRRGRARAHRHLDQPGHRRGLPVRLAHPRPCRVARSHGRAAAAVGRARRPRVDRRRLLGGPGGGLRLARAARATPSSPATPVALAGRF